MLKIVVGGEEVYDEVKEEFDVIDSFTLRLEHSLVSLSKWESKFNKPFLDGKEKTTEESLGYIEAMIVDDETPPEILQRLSNDNLIAINEYITGKMTATTIREDPTKRPQREIITSELIYFWMLSLNIPLECEMWHLNRLFTLMRVCNVKNSPPKKQTKREMLANQRRLNEERMRQWGTSG